MNAKLSVNFEGVKKLIGRKVAKYQRFPRATLGFSAPYAIYVHENMEQKWRGLPRRPNPPKSGVYWGPAGEPKYLTRTLAAMRSSGRIRKIIVGTLDQGRSLREAVVGAMIEVIKEASLRVPVDTGLLRSSGFVQVGETVYQPTGGQA